MRFVRPRALSGRRRNKPRLSSTCALKSVPMASLRSASRAGDLDIAELPTLRKYIKALGGQLRVVAAFGDSSLNLC